MVAGEISVIGGPVLCLARVEATTDTAYVTTLHHNMVAMIVQLMAQPMLKQKGAMKIHAQVCRLY